MILAGDIGGTHTRLALFTPERGRPQIATHTVYASADAAEFSQLLDQFLADNPGTVESCCLAIAGPVQDNRCRATNLPWLLDGDRLSRQFSLGNVLLINDLEANAHGLALLGPEDLLTVQEGTARSGANQAVIAAGTGLGEAGMLWDGRRHIPFATEGGHSDFGPRGELQLALCEYLQSQLGQASYETILSGDGLGRIYDFIMSLESHPSPKALQDLFAEHGKAETIAAAATSGSDPDAERALALFLEIYGQEAGNLALKMLATGGVYLGGGIAAKLAGNIQKSSRFLSGFCNKGKMEALMKTIPVRVILNADTALLGAGLVASQV